jgi:hypothetical protein
MRRMDRMKAWMGTAGAAVFVMFSQEVLTQELFRELLSMC